MKTPERILTEHALGEITFDLGIKNVSYCVFSNEQFVELANCIKLSAYPESMPSRLITLTIHLGDLEARFKELRFAFERLRWMPAQSNEWINAFCKPDHLAHYESRDELSTAMRWHYIRVINAALKECEIPAPTDWLRQSKTAAAREIAEFEELVK